MQQCFTEDLWMHHTVDNYKIAKILYVTSKGKYQFIRIELYTVLKIIQSKSYHLYTEHNEKKSHPRILFYLDTCISTWHSLSFLLLLSNLMIVSNFIIRAVIITKPRVFYKQFDLHLAPTGVRPVALLILRICVYVFVSLSLCLALLLYINYCLTGTDILLQYPLLICWWNTTLLLTW